jgi:uncharacterized protein (TIGR02118 family)
LPENKIVVIYPWPTDVEAFEKVYQKEHIPMAVEKLAGKNKLVATKFQSSPKGNPAPYYRIAEIHFPTRKALEACAASKDAQDTLAHAAKISTGGKPIVLIGEEEVFNF